MEKINSQEDLSLAILQLEASWAREGIMLREQFHDIYNRMKPVNLIKSTFLELVSSPEVKDNVVNNTVGMAAGYVSKMLFVGASSNPIKKILGTAVMFGITNIVTKNPEAIKALGKGILNLIRKKPAGKTNNTDHRETKEVFS
jgi:hypothetical protein